MGGGHWGATSPLFQNALAIYVKPLSLLLSNVHVHYYIDLLL